MRIYIIPALILSFSSCYALDDISGKTESLRRLLTDTALALTNATQRLTEIDDTVRTVHLSQSSRSDPSYFQGSTYTSMGGMAAPFVTPSFSARSSYGMTSSHVSAVPGPGSSFEAQEVTFGSGRLGFGGEKVHLFMKKKLERWESTTTEHLVESNRNYYQEIIRLLKSEQQTRNELGVLREDKRRLEGTEIERSRLSEELRITNDRSRILDQQISELSANLARKNDAYVLLEGQLRDSKEEFTSVQRVMEEKKREFDYSKAETARYIADLERENAIKESECAGLRGNNTDLKASLSTEKRKMEDFKRVIEEAKIQVQKQLDDYARKLKKKQDDMDHLEMQHTAELRQKSSEFQSKLEEFSRQSKSGMDDLASRHSTAVRTLMEYKEGVLSILLSAASLPSGILEEIKALSTRS